MSDQQEEPVPTETDVVEGSVVPAGDESTAIIVAEETVPEEIKEWMEPTTPQDAAAIELAFLSGDFGQLKPVYRRRLIADICKKLGVSIELRPFVWGTVADGKGGKKLVPIPTKSLYSQQRSNEKMSIGFKDFYIDETLKIAVVQVVSRTKAGQEDEDIGVVGIAGPTMGPGGVVLPGILTGDKLADALMTAVTRAKNRVTGSSIGSPQGPTDTEVAAGLITRGAKAGEITQDPEGPRRIDPNAGKLRRLRHEPTSEATVTSGAATAEDLAGLTDEVPEVAQRGEDEQTAVGNAMPPGHPGAVTKETRPAPAPPKPGAPRPAGAPAAAPPRAGGPPRPSSPRPGAPPTSKAPIAAPRTAPGQPAPVTRAPVKAPPRRS